MIKKGEDRERKWAVARANPTDKNGGIEEPTGVATRTERGCNKNRKGLEHEPKGDVSPVACGSHRVPKGATARIERGCKKNRKGLQQEPKGATT